MNFVNSRTPNYERNFKYAMLGLFDISTQLRRRMMSWTWNHIFLFLRSNGFIVKDYKKREKKGASTNINKMGIVHVSDNKNNSSDKTAS